MDNSSYKKIVNLIKDVKSGHLKIIYDDISNMSDRVYEIVENARNLKRKREYSKSIDAYLQSIDDYGLCTEILRRMCKTICSTNDYYLAVQILVLCAEEEESFFRSKHIDNCHKLPNTCSYDLNILLSCIIKAAKGDLKPLLDRTKELSGNPNYKPEMSEVDIRGICYLICLESKVFDKKGYSYILPKKFIKEIESLSMDKRLKTASSANAAIFEYFDAHGMKSYSNSEQVIADFISLIVYFLSLTDKKLTKVKHKLAHRFLGNNDMFKDYDFFEDLIKKSYSNVVIQNGMKMMTDKYIPNSEVRAAIFSFLFAFVTADEKLSPQADIEIARRLDLEKLRKEYK